MNTYRFINTSTDESMVVKSSSLLFALNKVSKAWFDGVRVNDYQLNFWGVVNLIYIHNSKPKPIGTVKWFNHPDL